MSAAVIGPAHFVPIIATRHFSCASTKSVPIGLTFTVIWASRCARCVSKVKTCASEQNTKLALVFYRERSQVSSTRSVVKTASKRAKAKLA